MQWRFRWPLWLYEFTVRSRISSYFVFKVSKPVEILQNYFSSPIRLTRDEIFDFKYFMIPWAHKRITIYDTTEDRKRKRYESQQYYDFDDNKSWITFDGNEEDMLLMSRESHLWVYPGFEEQFQKLFDNEDK